MDKLKILVVEDDKINSEIIVNILLDNYNVKVAFNGKEGFLVYQSCQPDIIIVDINMPDMNGLDMVRMIRKKNINVKIIMLTAYSNINYLIEATELKLTKYLVKPINKDELLESIELAVTELTNYTIVNKKNIFLNDGYVWNVINNNLTCRGIDVKLTPKEKKILAYLLQNSASVMTYDNIIDFTWDSFELVDKKSLKTMITGLRKKVPKNLIQNVYGIGYIILQH